MITVSALLLGIALLPGVAEANEVKLATVKCDKGETIGKVLEGAGRKPLVVIVQGPCMENITITRDDVTLQGDPAVGGKVTAADPTRPTILINTAQRVVIDNLTAEGGLNGVRQVGGSAVMTRNTIRANKGDGVYVTESGTARIGLTGQSEPGPNTITENEGNGIRLNNGALGIMFGNTVTDNDDYGIMITRAIGHMIGENIVEENRVGVFVGGQLRQGQADFPIGGRDTVQRNGTGIVGYANASVEIWDAAISDNGVGISLRFQAILGIRNSEIGGNGTGINMARDSGLLLGNQVVVTNNYIGVQCAGGDSSIQGDTGGITGNTVDFTEDCPPS